jgi:hypothetical protein
LVSSIPDQFIPATESKKNKFVKKLLPICWVSAAVRMVLLCPALHVSHHLVPSPI